MWPQPRMGDSVSVSARVERTGERGEVMPGRMERLEKATGQGCAGPVAPPPAGRKGWEEHLWLVSHQLLRSLPSLSRPSHALRDADVTVFPSSD